MTGAVSSKSTGAGIVLDAVRNAAKEIGRIVTCREHSEVRDFMIQHRNKWDQMDEKQKEALSGILNHNNPKIRAFPDKHPEITEFSEEKIKYLKAALMQNGDKGYAVFDNHFDKIKDYTPKEIEITSLMLDNVHNSASHRRADFMENNLEDWHHFSEEKKICTYAVLSSVQITLHGNGMAAKAWHSRPDTEILEYSRKLLSQKQKAQPFFEILPEKV